MQRTCITVLLETEWSLQKAETSIINKYILLACIVTLL